MSKQTAVFEVTAYADDHPTDRRRWNGDPMASLDADRALFAAVDAFRAALEAHGFAVTRTGYGVRAVEDVQLEAARSDPRGAADDGRAR